MVKIWLPISPKSKWNNSINLKPSWLFVSTRCCDIAVQHSWMSLLTVPFSVECKQKIPCNQPAPPPPPKKVTYRSVCVCVFSWTSGPSDIGGTDDVKWCLVRLWSLWQVVSCIIPVRLHKLMQWYIGSNHNWPWPTWKVRYDLHLGRKVKCLYYDSKLYQ